MYYHFASELLFGQVIEKFSYLCSASSAISLAKLNLCVLIPFAILKSGVVVVSVYMSMSFVNTDLFC